MFNPPPMVDYILKDYVKQIGTLSVIIVAQEPSNIKVIEDLGGEVNLNGKNLWRIYYDNEDQLAKILQTLQDANFVFGDGLSGWPPAGVARMLREKGKFHGLIRGVLWEGPQKTILRVT
ncbi:MAG TPA: hypothetical protein VMG59_00550 [Phycisphaerae bacterium]|nr:hypothetical protein [Phycisphaerae bacterium]